MKLTMLTIILAFFGHVDGLDCYTCTYGVGESTTSTAACADPFEVDEPHVIKTGCNEGVSDPLCAIRREITNGKVASVFRGCFPKTACPNPNGCQTSNGVNICCCKTDYCNGRAAIFAVNVLIIAVSLIIALAV